MSPVVVSLLVLGIFAVLLIPAFLMASWPGLRIPLGFLYGALAAGLLGHHLNSQSIAEADVGFGRSELGGTSAGDLEQACERALDLAERGGLVLDQSDPSRIIVSDELWSRLGQSYRDAITLCLERAHPDADRVEVVTR
jgi:hypothetical protein